MNGCQKIVKILRESSNGGTIEWDIVLVFEIL